MKKEFLSGNRAVREVSAGWGLETDFPFPSSMRTFGTEDRRNKDEGASEKRVEGERGAVFFVLIGWEERDERGVEEVRESVSLMVEMQGAVGWEEFCARCEVLEREGRQEHAHTKE